MPPKPAKGGEEKETRIAIVNQDKCKPKKCRQECKKSCPVVRMGRLCIEVSPTSKIVSASRQGLTIRCLCMLTSLRCATLPGLHLRDALHWMWYLPKEVPLRSHSHRQAAHEPRERDDTSLLCQLVQAAQTTCTEGRSSPRSRRHKRYWQVDGPQDPRRKAKAKPRTIR